MTTLVLCTQLSEVFLHVLAEEALATSEDMLLLVTNEELAKELSRLGYSPVLFNLNTKHDWIEHDTLFAELALPGKVLNCMFPNTELGVWEVLSLDRLSFFFQGKQAQKELELLQMLRFDKAIVSLDPYHHLPWVVGQLAKQRNIPCVAAQTAKYLPTREVEDLVHSPYMDCFSEIVVGKKRDAEWLNFKPKVRYLLENWQPSKVTEDERKEYRKGLGLGENEFVRFIVFDLPNEYEFGQYLAQQSGRILIWPATERAKELLPVLHGNRLDNALLVDWNARKAADVAVIFRNDWYVDEIGIPVERQ